MFSMDQREAVRSAFRLAGYDGPLVTWPVAAHSELVFAVDPTSWRQLRQHRDLELVLRQLLDRETWIVEAAPSQESVPFE